jgi:hypothetical protein
MQEQIEICNWEKFNPRKDITHSSWFRLEHSFMFDSDWDDMDGQEIAVWIYFLCSASLKNKSVLAYNPDSIALRARVTTEKVKSAVEKLIDKGCVERTVRQRNVGVTSALRERDVDDTGTCSTDGRTDVTDETDGRDGLTEPRPLRDELNPLVEIWNAECGELPKIRGLGKSRKPQVVQRWDEKPDRDYWTEIIRKIAGSSFCSGKNDRGWKADFDFLIRPDTQHRVLEGKYDDRHGTAPPTYAQKRMAGNLALLEKVNSGEL